jgi:hypothetical protein
VERKLIDLYRGRNGLNRNRGDGFWAKVLPFFDLVGKRSVWRMIALDKELPSWWITSRRLLPFISCG